MQDPEDAVKHSLGVYGPRRVSTFLITPSDWFLNIKCINVNKLIPSIPLTYICNLTHARNQWISLERVGKSNDTGALEFLQLALKKETSTTQRVVAHIRCAAQQNPLSLSLSSLWGIVDTGEHPGAEK